MYVAPIALNTHLARSSTLCIRGGPTRRPGFACPITQGQRHRSPKGSEGRRIGPGELELISARISSCRFRHRFGLEFVEQICALRYEVKPFVPGIGRIGSVYWAQGGIGSDQVSDQVVCRDSRDVRFR